ncbi:MAG: hypothetical protein DME13_08475 [Candidatus Rokuibacteriota bacterium]|nr:MAG: hypothetical protein DME13_08475 [Candidatus Rokubacteria bacterium]
MRIATYAVMLAQSFCSDVDRVVKLAPSGFQAILDDADEDPIQRRVTQRLPGASMCWYQDGSRSYWCSWNVPSSQTASQVRQLASAIGHCYHIEPDYETTSGDGTTTARDEAFAIVDLPDSISIYINGVAGTVWMSVTATDALDEMARRLKGGAGSSSPAEDPRNDKALSRVPDEFADPENSVPFARLPARQPANQYVPDGVRSPRDGSNMMPHSHGTPRR